MLNACVLLQQVVGAQLLPGGLTIDTSILRNVTVDPDSQTAYVQPGLYMMPS